MELSDILVILAIIVEGPIVWWLTSRHRKEDNTMTLINEVKTSIRKLHTRIDDVEDKHASKEYVDDRVEHIKEVVSVQFDAIMKNLDYIRSRLDDRQDK